jgi:hypothetical protein
VRLLRKDGQNALTVEKDISMSDQSMEDSGDTDLPILPDNLAPPASNMGLSSSSTSIFNSTVKSFLENVRDFESRDLSLVEFS